MIYTLRNSHLRNAESTFMGLKSLKVNEGPRLWRGLNISRVSYLLGLRADMYLIIRQLRGCYAR